MRLLFSALCSLSLLVACGASSTAVDAPVDAEEGEGGAAGKAQAGGAGASQAGATSGGGAGTSGGGAGASGGGAGTSGGSAGATTGGAGGGPPKDCALPPPCDAAPPDPGPKSSWNDLLSNGIAVFGASHRGRDLFLNPGDAQWVIAKFAYGAPVDKDLKGEDVDLYLLRDCQGAWEKLGTAVTTKENSHPAAEHVDDSGGRVFFQIPAGKTLGLGRHRVHLVVKGDLSSTDVFLEIVPKGQPMFVSDVDGTLTLTETEEYKSLLTGAISPAHPDAAKALSALAKRGYRPMYLTARPEYLVARTREFITAQGFPQGIVHTTQGLTGALGGAATTFKTDELAWIAAHGLVPAWAFGNTATDAAGYENAKISPKNQRIMFQFDDTVSGARRIETYSTLLPEFAALPALCPLPEARPDDPKVRRTVRRRARAGHAGERPRLLDAPAHRARQRRP